MQDNFCCKWSFGPVWSDFTCCLCTYLVKKATRTPSLATLEVALDEPYLETSGAFPLCVLSIRIGSLLHRSILYCYIPCSVPEIRESSFLAEG